MSGGCIKCSAYGLRKAMGTFFMGQGKGHLFYGGIFTLLA